MRALIAIRDFWFGRQHAAPMAAFRISLGLILLLDTGFTLLPHAARWFGMDGLFSPSETDWWQDQPGRWGLFYGHTDLATLRLGLVAMMLAAWGLIFGLGTRACAIVAFVLLLSFHHRNPNILNAGDILLRTGLFCLALMPSWRALSLDRSILTRVGWEPSPLVPAWSLRLAQIQICIMYVFTGLDKLGHFDAANIHASDWIDGSAIARSLRYVTIARTGVLAWVPIWATAPLTWITLAWEVLFPLLVISRRTRAAALAIGVLVHGGIFLTMEVTHFSLTTLAFYWLFVPASVIMDMAGKSENGERRVYRVFFDTMCPVCNRAKRQLERLDWLGRLKFEDLHDRKLCEQALPGVTYAQQLRAMYVLRPDGEYFAGFNALRALMPVLPIFWLFWPIWAMAWIPGFSHVGHAVYRYIARNRFKYASCDSEVCSLHLKLIAGKEMDDEVIAQVIALHERFNKAKAAPAVNA
jgi:predicted DCC family thiol-disulfide oxidoreductase YuxK